MKIKRNILIKSFAKYLGIIMLLALLQAAAIHAQEPLTDGLSQLRSGKTLLDKREHIKAVSELSTAIEKLPLLADYCLLWRSMAYEGLSETALALNDISAILSDHKTSSLIKTARRKEAELSLKLKRENAGQLLEAFVREYPSEWEMKFIYANYLKSNGQPEKSKAIYKELFLQINPFSASAQKELAASDISTEDLVKRAENLNNAWLFSQAEKVFRDALAKNSKNLTARIKDGLAYSVFRQKRYAEAAEMYKQLGSTYWRSRSLLRAGDIAGFEAEVKDAYKFSDKRTASLLVAYACIKRRDGNAEQAISILSSMLPQYSAASEEILWTTAWTLYITGTKDKAAVIFNELYKKFRDPKYIYWSRRASGAADQNSNGSASAAGMQPDFYSYAAAIRNSGAVAPVSKKSTRPEGICCSQKAALLAEAGFRAEAVSELLFYAKKSSGQNSSADIAASLHRLGSHKQAMIYMAKSAYSDEIHDLLYPAAYIQEVQEAAKEFGVDPMLLLAVMREESRFAADARSVAGAMGLLQLMPTTAQKVAKSAKVHLKENGNGYLYDPRTNIRLGACYLKQLIARFGSAPLAIAAYNAGEHMVTKWLKEGSYTETDEFIEDIPFNETRNYVKKVLTSYIEYTRSMKPDSTDSLRALLGRM
ncbi:MAG: lytic transglycosylase domain-containing protein [Nitrospiraceae bacterium]|nr:lytic transglycosylase domain-containing protein [Nitrospiraceae bacterium]